jgi:hypothetical protein
VEDFEGEGGGGVGTSRPGIASSRRACRKIVSFGLISPFRRTSCDSQIYAVAVDDYKLRPIGGVRQNGHSACLRSETHVPRPPASRADANASTAERTRSPPGRQRLRAIEARPADVGLRLEPVRLLPCRDGFRRQLVLSSTCSFDRVRAQLGTVGDGDGSLEQGSAWPHPRASVRSRSATLHDRFCFARDRFARVSRRIATVRGRLRALAAGSRSSVDSRGRLRPGTHRFPRRHIHSGPSLPRVQASTARSRRATSLRNRCAARSRDRAIILSLLPLSSAIVGTPDALRDLEW